MTDGLPDAARPPAADPTDWQRTEELHGAFTAQVAVPGCKLRPYQAGAIIRVRKAYSDGSRRILVQAPTGAGKTEIACSIIRGVCETGRPVLFTVPAIELVDQTLTKFCAQGITDVGVIQANHMMTDRDRPVQIASVQTLMRRELPPADLVFIDECFSGETAVLTPSGEKRIDAIQVGDAVLNATGVGIVAHVFCRETAPITLRLSNGQKIRTTEEHPFFTPLGWTKAGQLEVRTRLFSPQGLSAMRDRVCGRCEPGGVALEEAQVLFDILREEACKPDGERGASDENASHPQAHWTQTEGARREWPGDDRTSETVARNAGVGMAAGTAHPNQSSEGQRVSHLLQGGHGECEHESCHRVGRQNAQRKEGRRGQEKGRPLGDVWVESVSRAERSGHEPVFNLHVTGHPSYFAGGVLVHNCHRWFDFCRRWMLEPSWGDVPFVGFSATPWTRGLGAYYDKLIIAATTQNLIDAGHLSDFKVFAPAHPDLKGVRTVAGDYHEGDLGTAMDKHPLVADICETWLKHGVGRPTLAFAVNRVHAAHIADRFEEHGVRAGYMDAFTPALERAEIRRKFHNGEFQVVCNVGVLTLGIDWDVRCIILARPTKSEMLFVQIIGRGLRPAAGKDHCLILDHSDNTLRLGFVTDIAHDTLDDGRPPEHTKRERIKLPKECPQCAYLRPASTPQCPNCGFIATPVCTIVPAEGDLHELTRDRKLIFDPSTILDVQRRFYGELCGIADERGYKPGWAAHKFKEKFGDWPRGMDGVESRMPSAQTRRWVKSRMIAWAKGRERVA
jgi:DNA repair protein RadD